MHLEVLVDAVAKELRTARPEVGEPGDVLLRRRGGCLVEVDRGHACSLFHAFRFDQPHRAPHRAVSRPIPELPPITTTVCPARSGLPLMLSPAPFTASGTGGRCSPCSSPP